MMGKGTVSAVPKEVFFSILCFFCGFAIGTPTKETNQNVERVTAASQLGAESPAHNSFNNFRLRTPAAG
jgi:hypothetical protein